MLTWRRLQRLRFKSGCATQVGCASDLDSNPLRVGKSRCAGRNKSLEDVGVWRACIRRALECVLCSQEATLRLRTPSLFCCQRLSICTCGNKQLCFDIEMNVSFHGGVKMNTNDDCVGSAEAAKQICFCFVVF